ncbi:MAG: formylglycine-generating enzyme family protein [Candidatus Coatesbacteria bacterium]|nr:formylglycine-generating enzyme family protein [Candidatus Coatesbacteria bacterium]
MNLELPIEYDIYLEIARNQTEWDWGYIREILTVKGNGREESGKPMKATTALSIILACLMLALGAGERAAALPSTKEPSSEHKPGEVRVFDGIEFVWIPPGEFIMGAADWEIKWVRTFMDKYYHNPYPRVECEGPPHLVKISRGFWMGRYEVTQAQFERISGFLPWTEYAEDWKLIYTDYRDPNRPIVDISWDHAVSFCDALSAQGGGVYRLPTEAEWEYACRAGTTTPFYWGNDPNLPVMGEYCWYARNSYEVRDEEQLARDERLRRDNIIDVFTPNGVWFKPVGLKKPNAWGLYDMIGNATEMCLDTFNEDYYTFSPTIDPRGPARQFPLEQNWKEPCHVARGGSYGHCWYRCRSATRQRMCGIVHNGTGFRVVREE